MAMVKNRCTVTGCNQQTGKGAALCKRHEAKYQVNEPIKQFFTSLKAFEFTPGVKR